MPIKDALVTRAAVEAVRAAEETGRATFFFLTGLGRADETRPASQ